MILSRNTCTDTKILGVEIHVFNRCFALVFQNVLKRVPDVSKRSVWCVLSFVLEMYSKLHSSCNSQILGIQWCIGIIRWWYIVWTAKCNVDTCLYQMSNTMFDTLTGQYKVIHGQVYPQVYLKVYWNMYWNTSWPSVSGGVFKYVLKHVLKYVRSNMRIQVVFRYVFWRYVLRMYRLCITTSTELSIHCKCIWLCISFCISQPYRR